MTRSRVDVGLAILSGVLLALSFPRFGHPAAAWIALVPLLVALGRGSLTRAFWLGVTAGVVYFAGTIYWVTGVMAVYGNISGWIAVLISAALIAFLALFPALFAVVMRRVVGAFGAGAMVAAPIVWIAVELGRTYLFGGFPWVLLGYSQVTVLPIAQLGSVFGVYGVSALVVAVNAGLAVFALEPRAAGARRWVPAAVAVALVVVVAVWGSRRVAAGTWTSAGTPVRMGLLQGNVDQAVKWDATRASEIFAEYIRLTRQAIGEGAEIVLWPESSTPFRFEGDFAATGQLRTIAKQAHTALLVGSEEFESQGSRGSQGSPLEKLPTKMYNSAFLVEPDGSTGGVYRKMHLVPFGEYVPLKSVFFFAGHLVEAVSDFSPGEAATLLPVNGHMISTAICYEVVYPDLVRQFVAGGSELLTTITNDAWFGASSAPYQHFAQASMRAIEEGRYLVRSANTGISGIVDPYGHVLAESGIFEPAVIVGDARFIKDSTFYSRHGDVLAYAAAVATLVMLLLARRGVQSRHAYR